MRKKYMGPKRRRIFYGWFLMILCLGNQTIALGITNAFSVIFVALLSDFRMSSRAELSGIFSLFIFVYFFGSAIAGPLLDKFGPRIIIPFGSLLICIGLMLCSQISSPAKLYLFYGVITSFGTCCVGWLPNSVIITNWFVRMRGMAVGIVMCGNGLGMLVFIPLTQFLIERVEWRGAFSAIAILAILLLAPVNAIFQRAKPEEKGFGAYGQDYPSAEVGRNNQTESEEVQFEPSLVDALKNRSYWMICLANFCNPFVTFAITLHHVAYVVERGFDPMYVAAVLGLIGVFTMVGRIVGGTLSDVIGREITYSFFMSFAALAVISLYFLNQDRTWILPLYVVLGGLGLGVGGGLFPPILADLFPGPSLGRIMGSTMVFAGLGAALGSWIVGYLHDITNSYAWGFFLILIAVFGAVMFVWIAAPRRARYLLKS